VLFGIAGPAVLAPLVRLAQVRGTSKLHLRDF
jgi:hypothetical protein